MTQTGDSVVPSPPEERVISMMGALADSVAQAKADRALELTAQEYRGYRIAPTHDGRWEIFDSDSLACFQTFPLPSYAKAWIDGYCAGALEL